MKKCIATLLCLLMVFSLSGCGQSNTSENKKPSEEPSKEPSEEKEKEETVSGTISDASNNEFSIVTEDNKTYDFDRSKMKLEGDSLLVGETVKVTYQKSNGKNVASKCIVEKAVANPEDAKSEIDKMIDEMSIEEKVGQMFFVRCPDTQAVEDIASYHLGGYILFDRDFNNHSYQQVIDNLLTYQRQAKIPLLIGVDEEGGTVNRMSNYTTFRGVPFWAPQDLYAYGGFDLIKSDTKEKAELLKSVGINVNLAPVADVSVDSNDFIYQRSFGKSAQETANYVDVVVKEMKANNIGSTLKHFPGYGNNVDTHTGISIDQRSYESFQTNDFLPFEAGIQAGADSILVSHNIMTCVDDKNPASLSPKVHEILRNELNFKGVVMTDDLYMDAIKNYVDDEEAAVAAVKAGNDLLLCSNYREQLPAVIEAVNNKEIEESQLDASLQRILQWKKDLGLLVFD